MSVNYCSYIIQATALSLLFFSSPVFPANAGEPVAAIAGIWVIDEGASDNTDKQVEKAIKKAGGRIPRTNKKGKERYRGGPPDQEMYDHISYDNILQIEINDPEVQFSYPEGYQRVFYTDDRRRTVSASGDSKSARQDYSFADWEDGKLIVESRPRDGGRITETYSLRAGGQQLRLEVELKPSSFLVPIELVRIFNRYQKEGK